MFLKARRPGIAGDLDDFEQGGREFALPAGVSVRRDLAYGSDPAQRLDVYLPAGRTKAPVLFMVHGGAWMAGDKAGSRVVEHKVAHWVPRGYLFVSANYRLLPDADPLKQVEDVAAALAFAQSEAASWGGDSSRFVVMGHSSGAHLVAMLATDSRIVAEHGIRPWLGTLMLDSASMNVVETMSAPHRPLYDRVFGRNPQYWRAASPFYRLTEKPAAPMMLVCSSLREDSCPQARGFAEKVASLGGRVTMFPTAQSHGEINANLGREGQYTTEVDRFLSSLGLS